MHALEAQGSEHKRKACINFTQMNLFSKWYCNGNTMPHNWNLWFSYVIILVQRHFFMIFQSIVIPVLYHNKFLKFVCNVIDLCTTQGQIIKIVWSFPLMSFNGNVASFFLYKVWGFITPSMMRKSRLRWYGHVVRREETHWLQRILNFLVAGRKPCGRPAKHGEKQS